MTLYNRLYESAFYAAVNAAKVASTQELRDLLDANPHLEDTIVGEAVEHVLAARAEDGDT